MNNFSLLTEEEYLKICSVIPHNLISDYFKKNPKEFSKIRPGFRPSSVQNKDAIKLLVTHRDHDFVYSFVEKIVNKWLKEIQNAVQDYKNKGESEITSYIHTLYQSFFSDNVSAYFKLIDKDYNEDQLEMISNLVMLLKNTEEKQHKLESTTTELRDALSNSERKALKSEKRLEKSNKQLMDLTSKVNDLKIIEKQYQKLIGDFEKTTKEKESIIQQVSCLGKKVFSLNETVKELKKEKENLENSIREKIEAENERASLLFEASSPLAPIDMDEFKECFSYNLESIDVVNSILPVNKMLTTYIADILFRGKPIICNKSYANSLIRCVSNTLVGDDSISSITFAPEYDEKTLTTAIKNCGRIVMLDNFLGNYNETILITILDRFKSKIIILTVTYEKTLSYLPKDFLAYSYYVNLSHIPSFGKALITDEEPSVIEEKENERARIIAPNRFHDIIISIAEELGFSRLLSEKASEFITDDLSACATLAFYLIPYVDEVLGKNAFNTSESLQRYASHSPYKALFEEWFMS